MDHYCIHAEFLDNGNAKAHMTTSTKRGKSQYRRVPGMSAFKMWWSVETYARQLLEGILDGTVTADDFLEVWSDYIDHENGFQRAGIYPANP